MFSGIVEGLGKVVQKNLADRGALLTIMMPFDLADTRIGDSIAVNGCCLTVVSKAGNAASFDVVNESLRRTTLGQLNEESLVNVERSMQLGDRIHGHIVSGHVDAVVTLTERAQEGDSIRLTFDLPANLSALVAQKGSVALAGVSLTVGEVYEKSFCVYIIPHTATKTVLGALNPGDTVNIEVDMLARYIKRAMECGS